MPTDSVHSPAITEPDQVPSLTPIDVAALRDVADPWHRSLLAEEAARQLRTIRSVILGIRRDAVRELIRKHHKRQHQVALHLGVSRALVGQLASEPITESVGR